MPAPMNTDSRRKASADFHAKRKADGWKKSTHWLSPEAQAALEKLKAGGKSADTALNEALISAASPDRPLRTVSAPPGVRVAGPIVHESYDTTPPNAKGAGGVGERVLAQHAALQAMKPAVAQAFPEPPARAKSKSKVKVDPKPEFKTRLKGEWKAP